MAFVTQPNLKLMAGVIAPSKHLQGGLHHSRGLAPFQALPRALPDAGVSFSSDTDPMLRTRPTATQTLASISAIISWLALMKSRALSLPWPIRVSPYEYHAPLLATILSSVAISRMQPALEI